jgi:hypothetical protein
MPASRQRHGKPGWYLWLPFWAGDGAFDLLRVPVQPSGPQCPGNLRHFLAASVNLLDGFTGFAGQD